MNNRVIKFRAWDFYQNKMIQPYDPILLNKIIPIIHGDNSEWHSSTGLSGYRLMQFTGLFDKNDVEIYDRDLLNVFYTSSNGEHIHDCIFEAVIGVMGDLQLRFRSLFFESHGHNQYPLSTNLCLEYDTLGVIYEEQSKHPYVCDTWGENHFHNTRWKGNDKSTYIEVIGNIYENPELLEESK